VWPWIAGWAIHHISSITGGGEYQAAYLEAYIEALLEGFLVHHLSQKIFSLHCLCSQKYICD